MVESLHSNEEYKILLNKAMRFCDLQDRSPLELEQKLAFWGCRPEWIKPVLEELKTSSYLDEQRFAESFARGKFRIKGWGRMKIMAALLRQRIPSVYIKDAIAQIDEEEYRKVLTEIIIKKIKITTGDERTKINKTASYAIGKGYESPLVFEVINELKTE